MFWLTIALTAYLLYAASAVIDKYLLAGPIRSPLLYAGMVGALGFLGLFLLPFGWFIPTWGQFLFHLMTGAVFVVALAVYFEALKFGQATQVVPITTSFVPVFTLVFSTIYGGAMLTVTEITGFAFLLLGGLLITWEPFREKGQPRFDYKVFFLSVGASVLFALHFTFAKQIFDTQPFFGGLAWMGTGKMIVGAAMLWVARLHQKAPVDTAPKVSFIFVLGRVTGGLAGIVQNYAIAIASVSLVTALQGFQFAFLFILIAILGRYAPALRERRSRAAILQKTAALLILSIGLIFITTPPPKPIKAQFGVNFSDTYATHGLHLDWKKTYDAIIDELKPSWLRLPVYWTEVEGTRGRFDFSVVQYQINKAKEADSKIILAVGRKLPRWPECHIPDWAAPMNEQEQQLAVLDYVAQTVKKFNNEPSVVAWQVENEPLFPFGLCPDPDAGFLRQEVSLVKALSSKPVIVTDSGELSTWLPEAKIGDVLGTTMYRHVYHKIFGSIVYPFPPEFFHLKAWFARTIANKNDLTIINVELQGEPWATKPLDVLDLRSQKELMNADLLRDNAAYARKAGFTPILFWGAEWWYWLKTTYNDPSLWDAAKDIMKD